MSGNDLIRTIHVRQTTDGGDQMRRDLAATGAAATAVGQAVGNLAVVVDAASNRTLSAGPKFRKLAESLDATLKAANALERGTANAKRFGEQFGHIAGTAEAVGVQMARLNTVYDETIRKTAGLTAAQRSQARAAIEAAEAQASGARAFQTALNQRLGVSGGSGGDRAGDFAAAAEAADRLRSKYDPIFAAQQRYAATVQEIAELERAGILPIEAAAAARMKQASALDETIAGLRGLTDEQQRAAAAATALATAQEKQAEAAKRAAQGWRQLGSAGNAINSGSGAMNAGLALRSMSSDGSVAQTRDAQRAAEEAQRRASREAQEEIQRREAEAQRARATAAANQRAIDQQIGIGPRRDPGDRAADMEAAMREREAAEAAQEAARVAARSEISPTFKAHQEYEAAVRRATQAVREFGVSQEEADTYIRAAETRLHDQVTQIDRAAKAHANLSKGAGLTAYGYQNLAYQVNDVATSLASGISPMQTIAQQGGQIYQILSEGKGGVGGALKGIGQSMLGFARGIGLAGGAVGGLATVLGAAAVAGLQFNGSMAGIRQQVAGIGAASGATVGQLNAIAAAASEAGSITTSSAREAAAAFAATGRIGPSIILPLVTQLKDFAKTTGQEMPDAIKDMAGAFADLGGNGLDIIQRKLGAFNYAQMEAIRNAARSGDATKAQQMALDAMSGSLANSAELTSGWSKLTGGAIKYVSDMWDELGRRADKVFTGGTLEDQLESARKLLDEAKELDTSAIGRGVAAIFGQGVPEAQKKVADLEAQMRKREEEGRRRASNIESERVGAIMSSYNPASAAIQKMENDANSIENHFKNARIPAEAQRAMTDLREQARQLREDMTAGGAAFADNARRVDHESKTADYAAVPKSFEDIEFRARQRLIDADRSRVQNGDMNAYELQKQSIEADRRSELDTLRRQTYNATSGGSSGSYRIGIGQVPDQYRDLILNSANARGVNPDFMASLIRNESRFNPNARSPVGAEGIAQFMPRTNQGLGGFNAYDPAQALPKSAELLQQLLRQFRGNEVLAAVGYNAGPRTAERFRDSGFDPTVLPKETRKYIEDIFKAPPNAQQMVETEAARRREVELSSKEVELNGRLYGENTVKLQAQTEAQRRISDEQARGVEISDSYRESIVAAANAMAENAARLKAIQFNRDATFEREQLGRTDSEASAYARVRSTFGDLNTGPARAALETQQLNDNLRLTKDLAKDALGGFASDLMRGTNAAQALSNALTRIADKLLNMAVDGLVSKAFAGLTGAGAGAGGLGGILASFLGGGGSAAASGGGGFDMSLGGSSDVFASGFARGGIMTSDGPVPLRSYAGGGVAKSPQLALFGEGSMPEAYVPLPDGKRIPVAMSQPANGNGGVNAPMSIQVNMNGSSGDTAKDEAAAQAAAREMRAQAEAMWAEMAAREMRPGGALYAAGSRR